MRRGVLNLLFCFFLVSAILSFFSCGISERRDYREKGFNSVVKWEIEDICFEARATVSAPNVEGKRQVMLELISPETVTGIVYGYTYSGDTFCKYQDMTLEASDSSRIISLCRMLAPEGEMKIICQSETDGAPLIYATVKDPSGEICHLYLDPETYFPVKIHKGELEIRVSEFSAYERVADENTFGNIGA